MDVIWKYELEPSSKQDISIPEGYKILTAQVQREKLVLWVRVDPSKEKINLPVYVLMTGDNVPTEANEYIATFQLLGGGLVGHVFI